MHENKKQSSKTEIVAATTETKCFVKSRQVKPEKDNEEVQKKQTRNEDQMTAELQDGKTEIAHASTQESGTQKDIDVATQQ